MSQKNKSEIYKKITRFLKVGLQIDFLSPPEMRVLTYLLMGMATSEISDEIGIREVTVKYHITAVYSKLKEEGLLGREKGLIVSRPVVFYWLVVRRLLGLA